MVDPTSLQPEQDYDLSRTLAAWAEQQPEAFALHVPGRQSLTFGDLERQSRYVRSCFAEWGIQRGDIVACVLPSRVEMAVASMTLPASATVAPLNHRLTTEVYADILTRLQPKAIVLQRGIEHPLHAVAGALGLTEIELISDPSQGAGLFSLRLARRSGAMLTRGRRVGTDIAYVLTTSGTTGQRKLVPYTHRRSVLFANVVGQWCRLGPEDIGAHLMPLHLPHGLNMALMIPLLCGGSVVCLPESDVGAFFRCLDSHQLTWCTAGFTLHKEILQQAPIYRDSVAHSKLRFFRCGSGQLRDAEIDAIEQTFQTTFLAGLTCAEACTVTHDPLPPGKRVRGSVGVPIGSEVEILDEAGHDRAPGKLGEIIVRGPLVFDGYLADAQATEAAFMGDWYRTGDLGRFDADGHLFMAGRLKEVINRGGEKISPVEIDHVIESHPSIQTSATFSVSHETLGEELAVAVVKRDGFELSQQDVIDLVSQRMGPTRVPRQVYFVETLPRNEAGKVRRMELAHLLGAGAAFITNAKDVPARRSEPPASPLEVAVAGLWTDVLELEAVGRGDDFFLLGGDSLRGARLLTSVKVVFDVELPIELLFRNAATVAGMARAIEAARSGGAGFGRELHPLELP